MKTEYFFFVSRIFSSNSAKKVFPKLYLRATNIVSVILFPSSHHGKWCLNVSFSPTTVPFWPMPSAELFGRKRPKNNSTGTAPLCPTLCYLLISSIALLQETFQLTRYLNTIYWTWLLNIEFTWYRNFLCIELKRFD